MKAAFRILGLGTLLVLMGGRKTTAQEPVTQFQMFGHFTASIEQDGDEQKSDFSLGEHDFFVQSKITPRISFLSETVVAPLSAMGHSSADFKVSIERARIKYQYREWLSIIVGKMHSPVNYWNDAYHHGRLFFPTIDRPRSFGLSIPIHTLGLRLQGQNIGKMKFGYDLVIGNGMSANDVTDGTLQKSVTAAIHVKPWERSRISISAYRDIIFGNMVGAHAGHASAYHYPMGASSLYMGDLDFELYCFSFYKNRGPWETLIEASYNRTGVNKDTHPDLINGLDSLDKSNNQTFFGYIGRKIKERDRLYALIDYSHYDDDLHIKSHKQLKFGIGHQHEFSPFFKSQIQAERYTGSDGYRVPADNKWEIKFRLAYCLTR
jgi:hypothetical protein